jgi:hypothetical protein
MYASRPVSPAELRPRRRWLLLPAAILVAGAIATVLLALNLVSVIHDGAPKRTFTAGQTVTIHLTRDPRPGFYVSDEGAPSDECAARDSSGHVYPATRISGTATITIDGRTWHVLSHVRLPADGTYQVMCADTGANASALYGVGYPPGTGAMVGSIVALVLVPLFSVSAALVILVVVIVRRNSYRRRLLNTPPPPF